MAPFLVQSRRLEVRRLEVCTSSHAAAAEPLKLQITDFEFQILKPRHDAVRNASRFSNLQSEINKSEIHLTGTESSARLSADRHR